MCGGALALLEGSLSRGCCLQCSVLLALEGVLPNLELELSHKEPKQQTPQVLCPGGIYIAGDTLRHQPMGMGHMTVLQFRGPITFCVLQWCHPMLTRTLWRTSCSTRMITLYGVRKRIQARAQVPPLWAGTLPLDRYTPRQVHPPRHSACWYGHTVNKRVVRIPLEFILFFLVHAYVPLSLAGKVKVISRSMQLKW